MTLEDGNRKEGEEAVLYGDMEILRRATRCFHQPSAGQISPRKARSSDLPGPTRDFQGSFASTKGLVRPCSEVAKKSGDKQVFTLLVPGFEGNEDNGC